MAPTALITGSSQGIGKATALLFAQNGYDLILTARTKDKLDNTAKEIINLGRNVIAVPSDTGDHQAIKSLVNLALESFNHIDVLVNNAGICMTAPMVKTTIEDWQKILNVNVWGYIYTINTLLPHFIERKQGHIINVGSFGGKVPLPQMTAYCTSKYAITGLTETLRLELEPQGIHVSGIHPSVTNSDFMERAVFKDSNPQQMQKILSSPLTSQPEEVAHAILEAVKHGSSDVVVGTAKIPTYLNRFFPGIVQGLMQRSRRR